MSKKQKTLFDTWNKTPHHTQQDRISLITPRHCIPSTSHNATSHNLQSPNVFQSPKYSRSYELADPEFDYEAGKTWIYPTNCPIRDYQFSIVQEALFKNTLVVLPTGLGKTFIAAVVMYNIYRWFPNGKVIFMAPTKPLVAQQVDACFKITGISEEDTTQLTGTNSPELRKRIWLNKRVFFLTPQVLVNDLVRNICPAASIKCLVVDEAHKALGNHAYCQVVKELCNYTSQFRVLALTATPGSETQAVKQVLCNLQISHVEMRSEDSEDVQQYTHIRDIEKIVVPLGDRLNSLKSRFLDVINIYLKRLTLRKVMTSKNPTSLSKYQMLKLRETFSQNPPPNIDRFTYGLAMADFSLCISLYHAYELLLLHGATSFYNFLTGILNGDKSIPHARSELLKNFEFEEIMRDVKENYIPEITNPNAKEQENLPDVGKRVLPSHPKLEKLREVVLNHFGSASRENITDTRVMIFTQYRDSVQEIVSMFNQHKPLVKVMSFVGQSSKTATSAGYSQKQQLKVIQQFRSGGYNTLVSTCVGEEGLDIGEVDLIVCYDCPKSPIRLVQRMGRTGRLRKGRIIILVAEGKEEQMYNTCEYRKKTVHRAITKGFPFAQFYQNSPSLIPHGVNPVCVKKNVIIERKNIFHKATKVSKSPYLTEEEILEYDQHVNTSMNPAPMLPKRDCIILKQSARQKDSEVASSDIHSVPPQLSLSEWTLWQTTPQRTYMIPHSSKSLLLSKILELIHFPELLVSKNTSLNLSCLSDSAKKIGNISKSVDEFNMSFKQPRIMDLLPISKTQDDFIGDIPSPVEEIYEVDNPISKEADTKTDLPLFQQLFSMIVPKFISYSNCNLKLPPPTVTVLSAKDFSSAVLECGHRSKSPSVLHLLNKKIKAKIKRKSRQLGGKISFCSDARESVASSEDINTSSNLNDNGCPTLDTDIKFNKEQLNTKSFKEFNSFQFCSPSKNTVTPTKIISSSADLKNYNIIPAFNVSFDNSISDNSVKKITSPQDIKSDEIDLKGISFDIDFDFHDDVQDDLQVKPNNGVVLNAPINASENSLQAAVKFGSGINAAKAGDSNKLGEIWNAGSCNIFKMSKSHSPSKYPVLSSCEEKMHFPSNSVGNDVEKEAPISSKCKRSEVGSFSKFNKSDSVSENKLYLKHSEKICDLESSTSENSELSTLDKKPLVLLPVSLHERNRLKKSEKYNNVQDFDITFDNEDLVTKNNSNSVSKANIPGNSSEKSNVSLVKNINGVHPVSFNDSSLSLSNKCGATSFKNILNPFCKNSKKHSEVMENSSDECSLNFDISFSINDKVETRDETIKDQSVPKNLEMVNDLEEFDEDAHSILEQLFTSQKNVSADMDCSFSSPLTIKRCISETDSDKNYILSSKKQCIDISPGTGAGISNVFKVPPVNADPSTAKSKCYSKNSINQSINKEEASQYTLTQLLSLIDCTEKLEKKSVSSPCIVPKNVQKCANVIDVSSEDEVCPTPPKEEIKTKSKFIYSRKNPVKKSLAFEGFEKANEQHTVINKAAFNLPCTSSNSQFRNTAVCNYVEKTCAKTKPKNIISEKKASCDNKTDSVATVKDELNCDKLNTLETEFDSSEKITFDVSFELPFTQEDLETSVKCKSVDMNKAIFITNSSSEEPMDVNLCKEENEAESFEHSTKAVISNQDIINLSKNVEDFIGMDKKSYNEDFYSGDDLDDSESLLPSKKNEDQNSVCGDICDKICSTEIPKYSALNQNFTVTKKSDGNCLEDLKENLNFPFSSTIEKKFFESNKYSESKNVSFDSKINKISTIISGEHDRRKNSPDVHSQNENCPSSHENILDIKEKGFKLIATSNIIKSKQLESRNPSHLLPKQNSYSCYKIIDNDLKSKISIQGKMDDKNEVQMPEDMLFDLGDDVDETCDLLQAKVNSNIMKINAEKYCNLPVRNDPPINRSRINGSSEDFLEAKPVSFSKNNKESKKILKNKVTEKPKNFDNSPFETCDSKDYAAKDEMMLEFDVGDEDLSFIHEIENNNRMSTLLNNQDLQADKVINKSVTYGDMFDINHLNETTLKKIKPNNILNSVENFDLNTKDELCTSESKLSKLSANVSTKNVYKNILKDNAFVEEDDDFHFIKKTGKKKPEQLSVKCKKRRNCKRNEFLLSQAEVSGSDESEFESACEDDDLEESFINDESPQRGACTDQHAFYLRSLKNCAGLPRQFKLKVLDQSNCNFLPEQAECSKYMHDSFCVSDEDIAFLSSNEDEEQPHKLKNKIKKNRKVTKANKKLKRVVTYDSATSSEHEISPKARQEDKGASFSDNSKLNNLDESVIAIKKRKPKLVISSDEDDDMCPLIKPGVVEPRVQTSRTVFDSNNMNPVDQDNIAIKKHKPTFVFSSDEEDKHIFIKPLLIKAQGQTANKMSVGSDISSVVRSKKQNISTVKKCKPKFIFSSDEEDNGNIFIKPTAVELFGKTKKTVSVVNVNSAKDFENNQKCEFSLDFDANDVNVNSSSCKKAESAFPKKIINSATKQICLEKFNPVPSTSKELDSAYIYISDEMNNSKKTHSVLSTNELSTSIYPFAKTHASSYNFPEATGCDLETANVTFDIGWDEYVPKSESEVTSVIESEKYSISVPPSRIPEAGQSIILVDSRELASGKPVISALRSLHKVNPIVMQLNSADYIISTRLAVKRVLDSEFNNCSLPPKVVEKIKSMNEIYEKSIIIIERDNRKNVLSFNKNTTKYLQFAVHLNYHPSIKVLFSKSVENTSELISNLIQQEKKRGFHINVPVTLTPQNKKLYDFYSSFPKVSPICALNFIYHYPTIESFLKSSAEDLKSKGHISSHIALRIFKYFKSELTYHENL